jgi:hypothetical protein
VCEIIFYCEKEKDSTRIEKIKSEVIAQDQNDDSSEYSHSLDQNSTEEKLIRLRFSMSAMLS